MVSKEDEYISTIPTVAVNKQGVVAVPWYDRRGLPATEQSPLPDQPGVYKLVSDGYNVRARISLDGGQSWQPSVQLNESPGIGELNVGHTAGLTAASDGRFHATWVDNRTGENELWSASIEIRNDSPGMVKE